MDYQSISIRQNVIQKWILPLREVLSFPVSLRMWGKWVLNSSFGKEQLTHSFANVLDVIEKPGTTWHFLSFPSQSFSVVASWFKCAEDANSCSCALLLFVSYLWSLVAFFCSFDFGVRHAKHTSVPLNSTSDRFSLLIAFAVFLSSCCLSHPTPLLFPYVCFVLGFLCVGVLHTNSNGSEAFIQTIIDFFSGSERRELCNLHPLQYMWALLKLLSFSHCCSGTFSGWKLHPSWSHACRPTIGQDNRTVFFCGLWWEFCILWTERQKMGFKTCYLLFKAEVKSSLMPSCNLLSLTHTHTHTRNAHSFPDRLISHLDTSLHASMQHNIVAHFQYSTETDFPEELVPLNNLGR